MLSHKKLGLRLTGIVLTQVYDFRASTQCNYSQPEETRTEVCRLISVQLRNNYTQNNNQEIKCAVK
jgi:hypothetical protein